MNISLKPDEPLILSGRDVTAVLGPTNTGKTHLAIERMVAHESGVIGLPLRLLAREVYGRVSEKVGASKVALITGEEKIVPPGARYSVCTVEAMPRTTDAAFVAIDEVQLAGDLERGHIFTDRILHLRGRQETLLLGAATMQGILQKLLRGVSVVTRPRLSHLAYAGSKKLTRLPHRSAIVAFSADEVYAIGELIRRQRGGAAVVLGALSPRTRNAQVALFQSGDVDYLIATDAIGMGLNLDVDHVAFAQNRKFDGYQYRDLNAGELGQIAGRAGRHMRDGTFGVTGQVDPLSDELVERIESHDFDPVKVLQWRTARFDFDSIDALKRSIETPSPVEGLTRALPAVDAQALEYLSKDEEVRRLAVTPNRVGMLWETCALPDYRKIAPAQHADIIASIYFDLAKRGHVDENYMAEQVRRADSTDGDIDTLSHRIAQIRTWTFVSNRPGWLADPAHWQEKTREIEDRLSDALHERLTKRFVDRRTSVLMRRLRENSMPEAEISPAGTVTVEGHHVGELQGFRFTADQSADGEDAKAVKTAAQKALAVEFEARAERFSICANHDIALGSDGVLRWIGAPIGTLTSGDDPLRPRVVLLADEQLTGPARDKVMMRAERFVGFQIETFLKPLVDLKSAEQLSGIARGIAFRLVENFGLIERRTIADDVKSLDQEGRAALRRLGVRFGAYHIFLPALLKPAPASLVTLLWALQNDGKDKPGFGDIVHLLASGRTSVVVNQSFEAVFYKLAGFRILGRRAVRVDILERLADLIRPALSWRAGTGARPDGAYDGAAFMVTPPMMSILGANADDMEEILKGLGYRSEAKPAADVKAKLDAMDEAARRAAIEAAAKREAEAVAREEASAAKAAAEAAAATSAEELSAAVATDEAAETATTEDMADAADLSEETEAVAASADASSPLEGEVSPEAAEGVADEALDASSEMHEAEASGADEADEDVLELSALEPAADEPGDAPSSEGTPPDQASPDHPPLEGEGQVAPSLDVTDHPAESSAEAVASAATEGESVAAPETPAEEPKPILLWRPQRAEGRPRHRHGDRNRQHQGAPRGRQGQPAAAQAADGATEQGTADPRNNRRGKPRFDRDRQRSGDPTAGGNNAGNGGERRDGQQQRHGKPGGRHDQGGRAEQGNRHQHGNRPDRGERRDGKPDFRQKGGKPDFQPKPREERPVRFDPDSPFAKLAALRDQLKK